MENNIPVFAQLFRTEFKSVQPVVIGVSNTEIDSNGDLIVSYNGVESENLGRVVGADGVDGANGLNGSDGRDGVDGISPEIKIAEQTDESYVLTVKDCNGEFNTPNLVGRKGDKGDRGEKGETGGMLAKLTVDAFFDAEVTCSKDGRYADFEQNGTIWTFRPDDYGVWILHADYDTESIEVPVVIDAAKEYSVDIPVTKVYGVEWDRTGSTILSRTDSAEFFTDPVPYYNGMEAVPESPFDKCYPWSGIRIVEDEAGSLVEIPKFWYCIDNISGNLKIRIATSELEGFHVSPAHADRGDGFGERNYVYVGRYLCDQIYRSESGKPPVRNISKNTARAEISHYGEEYAQIDLALLWTIRLLYIVEYADWDSQKVIGYGCGSTSSPMACGYTDSMPYHTGTTADSRTAYGGTQYRYIEGLWDSLFEWTDGVYMEGSRVYVQMNPALYAGHEGAVEVLTRSMRNGYIASFAVSDNDDYAWAMMPDGTVSTQGRYIADFRECAGNGNTLYAGGSSSRSQKCGMFFQGEDVTDTFAGAQFGCRIQKLVR